MTTTTAAPATIPLPLADHAPARAGLAYGVAAYLFWGLSPLYFKLIAHVNPVLIVAHRVAWSVAFLAALLTLWRQWPEVARVFRSGRTVLLLACTTALIAANWLLFVWAIGAGQVLQASLGYFMNPLAIALLGIAFLRERLTRGQTAGLALAAVGVMVLAWGGGGFPWLAVSLAVTFALYGLLRKTAHAGPLAGLSVETALLLPVALLVVAGFIPLPQSPRTVADPAQLSGGTYALLALAGPVTVFPLLCFAAAAKRLRLITLGFLQYLSPTCHFLLAVFAFGEPFDRRTLLSFAFVWAALVAYSVDSARAYRARRIARREEVADAQDEANVVAGTGA